MTINDLTPEERELYYLFCLLEAVSAPPQLLYTAEAPCDARPEAEAERHQSAL